MRYIALIVFGLLSVASTSAQYATLRPRGAVPLLDGCNGMAGYPDCHPDRIYEGRSVIIPVRPGMRSAAPLYPPGTRFYPAY
jgi:hypothetical protein